MENIITQNGGTIYIKQYENDIQYQYNDTIGPWTTFSLPVIIINSNPVEGNILTISIITNITISNATQYFITGSNYITYDGTGKIITVDSVSDYLGLIQNGTSSTDGYHAITVKNINSAATGGSTLNGDSLTRSGWICQACFGFNIDNIPNRVPILIDNCSNSATINSSGVGNGGIVGGRSFANGYGIIQNCYNTGIISGTFAGGITGDWFGYNSNNLCSIINCYNTGNITGSNAGGITGAEVGYNDDETITPQILIQNCYSLGSIATTAGGICGGTEEGSTQYGPYINIPIVNITNCYTSYNSIAQAGSQYISLRLSTAVRNSIINNLTNVYTSLINSWSDNDANSALTGFPRRFFKDNELYIYYTNFGLTWYSKQQNTPFFLISNLDKVPRRKIRQ